MDSLSLAQNLIERSQAISIFLARNIDEDGFGAGLALFYTLKKMGKNVNLFFEKIPPKFQFLLNNLSAADPKPADFFKKFIISINTSGKEILEMFYEKNEKDLKIYLTLNGGEITERDIAFSSFNPSPPQKSDLVITLGAQSLEDLGIFFEQNPNLFYELPILNIDNYPSNENFGEINLIEITSPSLSEILTDLIKTLGLNLIDNDLATFLLAGILFASQNFQNPKTRPKTFETASFLVEKGADHQKIIQYLYRQRSIAQVRLLGQVLKKINFDEKTNVYTVCLSTKDFQGSGSSPRDLGPVIEELKFNFGASLFPQSGLLILWESHASPTQIRGIFYSPRLDLIEKILENFEGTSKKNGVLFLIKEDNLFSAKEKVLKVIS